MQDLEITIKGVAGTGKSFLIGEIHAFLNSMGYNVECFDEGQQVVGQMRPFPRNFEPQNITLKTEI